MSQNRQIMVTTYSANGESFVNSNPRLWSEERIAGDFDFHPDGKRVAVLMAADEQVEEKRDKVVLIQNFFELLRQEVVSQ